MMRMNSTTSTTRLMTGYVPRTLDIFMTQVDLDVTPTDTEMMSVGNMNLRIIMMIETTMFMMIVMLGRVSIWNPLMVQILLLLLRPLLTMRPMTTSHRI